MGKIKVLKKSTLSGKTENDDYKIYPVTKTDAVFTDDEDKDECDTQTPQGANKTTKEIFNSIRKRGWVNKERIKDGAVTMDKLTPEMRELINSATGVPENLVKEMEQWNNRIAAQETINSELIEAVGTGGSVDSRIASAVATETSRAQEAEANRYTKNETYTKEEVNNLITTPNQEYVSVTATDQTTAVTDVLPAIGLADTVYRVGSWDGSQYDVTKYSEYAWNGKDYVHLSTKTQIGDVFDISAYHATGGTLATYANLEDALGTNGKNIPQSLRKGGMSVKFVQTSDNKYVQFRCMAQSFTTDVTQWQGVDEEPTVGSENLVKSGGVAERIYEINGYDKTATYKTKINILWPNTGVSSISLPAGSYKFEFNLPLQNGVTTGIYLRKGVNEPYLNFEGILLDGKTHAYVIDTTETITQITFGPFNGDSIDHGTITTNIYSVYDNSNIKLLSAQSNRMRQAENYTQDESELVICDDSFNIAAKLVKGNIKTKMFDTECYDCVEDGFYVVDPNFNILIPSFGVVRNV